MVDLLGDCGIIKVWLIKREEKMYGIGDFCVFLGLVPQGSEMIAEKVEQKDSYREHHCYYRNDLHCYKLVFKDNGGATKATVDIVDITQDEYNHILELEFND